MVERMEEGACQRKRRDLGQPVRGKDKIKADSYEYYAYILYAMISQKPLYVMLFQSVNNAKKRGNRPGGKYQDAPPCRRAENEKQESHKPINGHLYHDPGHQCRNV